MTLSDIKRKLPNFSELKDPLRISIQSGIAVSLTYLFLRYINSPEIFVGLLSAVLVLEPTIGSTLSASKSRLLSTFVGCLLGFICMKLLPWGIGTMVAVCVSVMVVSFVATIRPAWQYGIVGCIAIALGAEDNAVDATIARLIAIGGGATVGIMVSIIIWPSKTSARTKHYIGSAIECIAHWLALNAKRASLAGDEKAPDSPTSCHQYIEKARAAVKDINYQDNQKLYDCIEQVENFFNSVVVLHRLADKKEGDKVAIADSSEDGALIENFVDSLEEAVKNIRHLSDSTLSDTKHELQKTIDSYRDHSRKIVNGTQNAGTSERDQNIYAIVMVFALEETMNTFISLSETYLDLKD